MRAPRDGGRRRGSARRGARAHVVSAQGGRYYDGDVCTDLSGSNSFSQYGYTSCEACLGPDGTQVSCSRKLTKEPGLAAVRA